MRNHVSTASALAAVTLVGVSMAGVSPRSPERSPEVREANAIGETAAAGWTSVRGAAVGSVSFLALPRIAPDALLGRLRQQVPPPRREGRPQEVDPRSLLRESGDAAPATKANREFYFTRAIYSDYAGGWGRWGGRGRWATDYPKADYQFLVVLSRLIDLDAYEGENAISLDDPALRSFPFLYALEVARMDLTEGEIAGLRGFLEAGGFLVIDDFWGDNALQNLAYQLSRVLPGRPIRRIPMDHPIFNTVYDIEEIRQVPNVRNGRSGGPTTECWGCEPYVFGIFDDHDRLMVVINWNTDLGDAWEWAEDPWYPLQYSTFAYEMGVNMVVYGMSH